MKIFYRFAAAFFISCCLVPVSFAAKNMLTLVNHFDKPIFFTVNIHPEILHDLPEKFSLETGSSIETVVLDTNSNQAYLQGQDNPKTGSIYLGVKMVNGQIHINGYVDHNIAYSWDDGHTIIFCTPTVYTNNGNTCSS